MKRYLTGIFLLINFIVLMMLGSIRCNQEAVDLSVEEATTFNAAARFSIGEQGYTPDLIPVEYPIRGLQYNEGGIRDTTYWWVSWQYITTGSFLHRVYGIDTGMQRVWQYACLIFNGAKVPKGQDSARYAFVVNAEEDGIVDDWGTYYPDMLSIELMQNGVELSYPKGYFYFQDEACMPEAWSKPPFVEYPLQALHVGCAVVYYNTVPITGLSGDVDLCVTVNPLRKAKEQNYRNNEAVVGVMIDDAGVHLR
jgi:hypothetical protein